MTGISSLSSFQDALKRCYLSHPTSDLLASFRKRAWERYLETESTFQKRLLGGLLRQELTIPEERRALSKEEISSFIPLPFRSSCLVFIDGFFHKELSNISSLEGLLLLQLDEAMQSYGIVLQNRLSRSLKEEKDPFALLNMAFCQDGAFLYLSPDKQPVEELLILHVVTGREGTLFSPRLELFVGKGSSLSCVSHVVALEAKSPIFYNTLLDSSLEEESSLSHSSLVDSSSCPLIVETVRSSLKRRAKAEFGAFSAYAPSVRRNYRVSLAEEEAEASLKGLSLLAKDQNSTTEIEVRHLSPLCTSNQLFKGVLFDEARASFAGKIYVAPEAQQTISYQLNKNLLLSDQASIVSQPDLEVLADDVKASHGATVGQLDQEELFYLQARGIEKASAEALLIRGFSSEVLLSTSSFIQTKIERCLEKLCQL